MSGTLLLLPCEPVGVRTYEVIPNACGSHWHLTIFEDGKPVGGGRFEAVDDGSGFDEGFEAAIDQGEAWL